jgi:nitrogen fixation protein NifQ
MRVLADNAFGSNSPGKPAAAREPFVKHVFASIWAIGLAQAQNENGDLSQALGLARADLVALARAWSPHPRSLEQAKGASETIELDEEEGQLLRLLDDYRADAGAETFWLARMVTRRSMQPNHLWQDLGLNDRGELSRLLRENFPELAAANVANMKWKKFFYRRLCEMEGFTLCTAPSCRECDDFDRCFGPEDGESLLARIRRENTTEALSHL